MKKSDDMFSHYEATECDKRTDRQVNKQHYCRMNCALHRRRAVKTVSCTTLMKLPIIAGIRILFVTLSSRSFKVKIVFTHLVINFSAVVSHCIVFTYRVGQKKVSH